MAEFFLSWIIICQYFIFLCHFKFFEVSMKPQMKPTSALFSVCVCVCVREREREREKEKERERELSKLKLYESPQMIH